MSFLSGLFTPKSATDPIVSPVRNGNQWEGGHCINATLSNGRAIPVSASKQPTPRGHVGHSYDHRTEISTTEVPVVGHWDNNTAYRIATIWRRSTNGTAYNTHAPFDYSEFNLRKIGNVLVPEDSEVEVRAASQRERLKGDAEKKQAAILIAIFCAFAACAWFGWLPQGNSGGRSYLP